MRLSHKDYILIDQKKNNLDRNIIFQKAQLICHRKKGMGALGILLIEYKDHTPFVTLIDKKGNPSNDVDAYLCAARYLFEKGSYGEESFHLQTPKNKLDITHIELGTYLLDLGRVSAQKQELNKPIQSDLANIKVKNKHETQYMSDLTLNNKQSYVHIATTTRKKKEEANFYTTYRGFIPANVELLRVYPQSNDEFLLSMEDRKGSLIESVAKGAIALTLNGFGQDQMITNINTTEFYINWAYTVGVASKPEYILSGRFTFDFENSDKNAGDLY